MGEQTNLLPSLDSTMALIASRRSIMPKDLSGEPLQRAEVKNYDYDGQYDNVTMSMMIMVTFVTMTMTG